MNTSSPEGMKTRFHFPLEGGRSGWGCIKALTCSPFPLEGVSRKNKSSSEAFIRRTGCPGKDNPGLPVLQDSRTLQESGWGYINITTAFYFLILSCLLSPAFAETPNGPNLGQPATPEQIKQWNIGVFPDGEGLPPGEGSVAEGRAVYQAQCMSCHGPDGLGGSALQLAGAQMPLTSDYPELTIGTYWPYATTLFDMIRRSMPMNVPGSLSDDKVYAVSAYLLYLNDIVAEDTTLNAENLADIKMPNRDGFINVYEQEKAEKQSE